MMDHSQNQHNKSSQFKTEIRYGVLEHLDIYQLKEWELKALEEGVADSLCIGLATFLLGLAFAFIIAIRTTRAALTDRTYYLFAIIAAVTLLGGFVLGCIGFRDWWRKRRKIRDLVRDIRGRIPPTVQETPPEVGEPPEPGTESSPM